MRNFIYPSEIIVTVLLTIYAIISIFFIYANITILKNTPDVQTIIYLKLIVCFLILLICILWIIGLNFKINCLKNYEKVSKKFFNIRDFHAMHKDPNLDI